MENKYLVLAFIVAIIVGICLFKAQNQCDKENGTLVKTALNWVKCIHEK